jgi:hypothetical protein
MIRIIEARINPRVLPKCAHSSSEVSPAASARPAVQLDPENFLESTAGERVLRRRRALRRALRYQLFQGHAAQPEEQLGLLVQPRATP